MTALQGKLKKLKKKTKKIKIKKLEGEKRLCIVACNAEGYQGSRERRAC